LSLWLSEASEITSSHIAVTHVQPPFLVDFVVSLHIYDMARYSLYMKKCNKENKYMTLAKHTKLLFISAWKTQNSKENNAPLNFVLYLHDFLFSLMKHTNLMIAPIFIRSETLGLKRNSKKTASVIFGKKRRV
jgi:hypothetical protein